MAASPGVRFVQVSIVNKYGLMEKETEIKLP